MPDHVLIVGRKPVLEALEREPSEIEKVWLQQGGRGLHALRRRAREAGVPVQEAPLPRINSLAGKVRHQGVVAVRSTLPYHDVEAMLAAIARNLDVVRRDKPRLLLLDRIEDPRNFGALVRTAVAAGVKGVIVPTRRMAPLSAAMIKASAGAAQRIPIARTDNLMDTIEQLKERGYYVAGASGEEGVSVWDANWDRPMALVVGSEGKGLQPRIAEHCDFLVSIPMPGDVESLNVSVAAGILLFASLRDR